MEFSQAILEYMETHHVSGYRLAKETGISESLFGKWRKNPTSKIDASTLAKIAQYFHVTMDELLGVEPPSPFDYLLGNEETSLPVEGPDPLKEQLLEMFDSLTPKNRGIALAQLEVLRKSQEEDR